LQKVLSDLFLISCGSILVAIFSKGHIEVLNLLHFSVYVLGAFSDCNY